MFIMLVVISLITSNLFGQGAYVSVNAGYGIGMGTQSLESSHTYTSTSTSEIENFKKSDASFGKGLNFGCTFGYMINKNIGAEIGFSYLLGDKIKIKDDSYTYGYTNSHSSTDFTESSKMFRINPSLIIASGLDKLNLYAKFGLVIGIGSVTDKSNNNSDGSIVEQTVFYNGGMAIGLSSGIGFMFKLSDKMSFYTELNMVNLSYAPTKGKITVYTYNGVDKLPTLTTKQKETDFVDSYTTDSNNPIPDSQPDKALKSKAPFGSFGINIGLKLSLSK